MTVPYERSLAMKSAGDFLRKIRNSAGLPAELQEEAAASSGRQRRGTGALVAAV